MKVKKIAKTVSLAFLLVIFGSTLFYHLFRTQLHSLDVRRFNPLARTGLNPVLPDIYSCDGGCNDCNYYVIKLGLIYFIKPPFICRAMACPARMDERYDKPCHKDWKYSRDLKYRTFNDSTNLCINSYKNATYPISISGKSSASYLLTKQEADIALREGVYNCVRLERALRKEGKFTEKQLLTFFAYLNNFSFTEDVASNSYLSNNYHHLVIAKKFVKDIKEVFDFLKANPELANKAIPENAIADFEQNYQEYRQRIKQLEQLIKVDRNQRAQLLK